MKKRLDLAVSLAVFVCLVLVIQGCTATPKFSVEPGSISFGSTVFERRVTLKNEGTRALNWSVDTVMRAHADAPWTTASVSWLACEKDAGSLKPGVENLVVTANRSALEPGLYDNVGLRFICGSKQQIVPVSLTVAPLLKATPSKVYLKPDARNASFELENQGDAAVTWQVRYFEGIAGQEESLPGDMMLTPAPGRLSGKSRATVRLEWTRERGDFGLKIFNVDAPGNFAVVYFTFSKPLGTLGVDPETLRVYYQSSPAFQGGSGAEQPVSRLTLKNKGNTSLSWTLSVNGIGGVAADIFQITPVLGTLQPGQEGEVLVSVSNAAAAIPGSGNYELRIDVPGADGTVIVPLVLEVVSLPVVVASDPPEPHAIRPTPTYMTLLDFGREETSKKFFVFNAGALDSRLYFRITHDDENAESPLVVDVSPMRGNTTGPNQVFYLASVDRMVDAQQIVVTVDRSAMKEDLEYRNLTIEAWDEEGTGPIAAVEPWTVQIKVERAPMTIEGALNRSRPPYLMRFALLLRDMLGEVIPTRTPEDLGKLSFEIQEDGEVLDLNETAMQVNGPENLKVNLVLLLDYTGSMYKAGVGDPESPRLPGEVLEEIKESASMFLDDLPPGYRVALMYHNDRQPRSRMIHGFSTDRASLKAALKRFSVPPALHGTSDVYDALIEAIQRLAAEDAEDVLPFDDADLRSVVFISDGKDNSSTQDAAAVVTAARNQKVRLYPLTYSAGSAVNYPDMIKLADETGGHLYRAGNAANLVTFLGHRRSLVLKPVQDTGAVSSTAAFIVKNAGKDPLSWQVKRQNHADWLRTVSPADGTLAPGEEVQVLLSLDPALLNTPGKAGLALLDILSSDGSGAAELFLALNDAGTDVQQLSLSLRDEPGRIWNELSNQIVLSYVTPLQRSGKYSIIATWRTPQGKDVRAMFEEDGMYYHGDVHGGQLSLYTTGISLNRTAASDAERARAEVYVRADYVPRNVNFFRMRFISQLDAQAPAAVRAAFDAAALTVEIDQEGLLYFSDGSKPNWRMISKGNHVYELLTTEENPLPYASSGNLLRIRFDNLLPFVDACAVAGIPAEFYLGMRVDNSVYYAPASNTEPSGTVYFTYPSGPLNPDRSLWIGDASDLAAPARSIADLAAPGINPEAPDAWDRDGDGLPDFDDPYPDDETRPGRILQPESLSFNAAGDTARAVTITNNRWDTFNITALSVEIIGGTPLQPDQFSWSLEGDPAVADLIDSDEPIRVQPGETLHCTLFFDPASLAAGNYSARIRLKNDLYPDELTLINIGL